MIRFQRALLSLPSAYGVRLVAAGLAVAAGEVGPVEAFPFDVDVEQDPSRVRVLGGRPAPAAATTIETDASSIAFPEPGNRSCSRSVAFPRGDAGVENWSVIGCDIVAAKVPTPVRATTQAAGTSGQRR